MRKVMLACLVLLAGSLAAGSIAGGSTAGETTSTAVDQHGAAHAWRGAVGELTVLDFAATWCGPCRRTLPQLQAFADDHPQLRIVVVSVDKSARQRDQLVADLDLRLPVVWDAEHTIAEHYRPQAMPSTVVLDASGREIYRHAGSSSKDWRAFVDFVEKQSVAAP